MRLHVINKMCKWHKELFKDLRAVLVPISIVNYSKNLGGLNLGWTDAEFWKLRKRLGATQKHKMFCGYGLRWKRRHVIYY